MSASLAAGHRSPARLAARGVLAVAVVALIAVAFAAGWAGRDINERTASGPISSAPVVPGSPVPSPSPTINADQSGIPFLNPSDTFPPSIEGQAVVQVGPVAEAAIAAATDDSPIYVSGWIIGADIHGCPSFDAASDLSPDGVAWNDCAAVPLRAGIEGGATLLVHQNLRDWTRNPVSPGRTQVLPMLVQVHVHDRSCDVADCDLKAVIDRVLMYGSPSVAPPFLAETMPPDGISAAQAVAVAREQDVAMFGEPLVLQSVEAGPYALVADHADGSELDWVWAVRFVSDDGHQAYTVYVDYLTGESTKASGSTVDVP